MVSGTSVAHLITLAVSPILTRVFPAEAFGELQLFHSIVVILSIISTGCFEYTYVLPKSDRDASILFRLSLVLNFFFSGLFYLVIFLIHNFTTLSQDLSAIFIWLLPLGIFFNSALNILTHWIIRFEQYGLASKSKILQSSTIGGTQTGFGVTNFSGSGLIIGYVFGRLASTIYLFFKREKVRLEKHFFKKQIREISSKYLNTTKFLIPSNLISYGAIEIPVFVIGTLFDQETLGFYALAYRVLSVPSAFIGTSVGHVFFKQLSDKYNEQKKILGFLYKTWGVLFLITILPTGILLLWSETLFAFIFGEQWLTAGTIAVILAPLLAVDFISAPTGKTLIVLKKEKVMPAFSLLNLLVRAGGLTIGWAQNDFLLGLILMVIGHIAALIIYNIYLLKAVHDYDSSISQNRTSL